MTFKDILNSAEHYSYVENVSSVHGKTSANVLALLGKNKTIRKAFACQVSSFHLAIAINSISL